MALLVCKAGQRNGGEVGMTETEAIIEIASQLKNIRVLLAFINLALWCILLCKRSYSYTDGIKDAIKELTSLIRSRR